MKKVYPNTPEEKATFALVKLIGCMIIMPIVFFVNFLLFDYSLDFYFAKDIPWYFDGLAGFFVSPILVPAFVIALILRCCGVKSPLFPS